MEEWISLHEFMRRHKVGQEVACQMLASGKYVLIRQPKYKDMAKRTDVGIRINLPLAEKLILGG